MTAPLPGRPIRSNSPQKLEKFHVYILLVLGIFRSDDVLVDLPSKAIRKLVELGLSAKKSGAKVKT